VPGGGGGGAGAPPPPPRPREVHFDQHVEDAPGAGRAAGEPARGSLPAHGLHDVGRVGHLMCRSSLERPDVVPPGVEVRKGVLRGPKLADVVVPDRAHAGLNDPPDRLGRDRLGRGDELDAGGIAPGAPGGAPDRLLDLPEVRLDLVAGRRHVPEHREGAGRARGQEAGEGRLFARVSRPTRARDRAGRRIAANS